VAAALFWLIGAFAPGRVPRPLHGVRAGLLRRLHGGVERDPGLHTPLMSVTNAISSIIAIGALVQIAPPLADGALRRGAPDGMDTLAGRGGIVLTAVNMFGGFAVTQRMLAMFRK
jgi:NAD(P) transhydrogenase subunit alpha